MLHDRLPLRILVAEDHFVTRIGFKAVLTAETGADVRGAIL